MVAGFALAPSRALARGLAPVRTRPGACAHPLSMQAARGGESGLSSKNCCSASHPSVHLPATAREHACARAAA
jgi:hypothetical protein